MVKVYASLAGARKEDFLQMVEDALEARIDGFHLDYMDGSVTPGAYASFDDDYAGRLVSYCRSRTRNGSFYVGAHLLVRDPSGLIMPYKDAGVSEIIIHAPAFRDDSQGLVSCLKRVRGDAPQRKVGLSVNVADALDAMDDFSVLGNIDCLHIIGSGPGVDRAPLTPGVIEGVEKLYSDRSRMRSYNPSLEISVDGGVNPKNAVPLKRAGVDRLVLGSAFFRSNDYAAFVRSVKSGVRSGNL